MAVVVVPMLEPSVSGYALSMLITPIPGRKIQKPGHQPQGMMGDSSGNKGQRGRNSPISGVIEDVNTELLCTMKVMPAPTRMAR